MTMQIIDCDQNTPEWINARLGIPTASKFGTVQAKGKGGAESLTRKKYLYELAGEIVTGQPTESYSNGYMERGHEMEPEARSAYAFLKDVEPQQVGFIRNGRMGASPDSLVGADGLLEIKSKAPHILIEAMFRDDAPPEHTAQCQGQLMVAEREWLDLACYFTGMPLVVHRIARDEVYIAGLRRAIAAFTEELDALVERVRAYGNPGVTRQAFRESVDRDDPALIMRY